jgi:phosphoglycerol transferase MdoB-like AlkP superfamily enzyme
VVADHCSSSAGKRELNLAKHHIPLMLYAPSILPARADSRLASQVDLGPTLLSMLGVSYEAQHYGVDLQTHEPEQAFVGNYQTLGYFDGDYLTCLSTGRRVGAYEVLPSLELKEATVDPAKQTLTTAYYQSASYLFDAGLLKIGDDGTLQARR